MTRRTRRTPPARTKQSIPAPPAPDALWIGPLVVLLSTGCALGLYWAAAAPGLTWAHHGADGGDLLAAAVSGGVPHPSGYPLYTALLQTWLSVGQALAPQTDMARLGNLLSALLAALSVGVTTSLAGHLAGPVRGRWGFALAAALLWTVSPLAWSQALITEVYALHMLLVALLAWAVLTQPHRPLTIAIVAALGLANHLTFALLLPAAGYWLWRRSRGRQLGQAFVLALLCGISILVLLYARIPRAAAGAESPPPVNWGYADNWDGFWWLVSGAPYHSYLANLAGMELAARVGAWARTLMEQYTVIGLALAGIGLAVWDRRRPELRNFSLLWVLPVSIYAILYSTSDSQVYLLPVTWMLALWLSTGLFMVSVWLHAKLGDKATWARYLPVAIALAAVLGLTSARMPALSLRQDAEAQQYLKQVLATIEPGSIVVSGADEETFALWYAAWASGELLARAPDAILVNHLLYQFDWYARLLRDLYPDAPGIGQGLDSLLAQNAGRRPVYFTEPLEAVPADQQEPAGPVWRYIP